MLKLNQEENQAILELMEGFKNCTQKPMYQVNNDELLYTIETAILEYKLEYSGDHFRLKKGNTDGYFEYQFLYNEASLNRIQLSNDQKPNHIPISSFEAFVNTLDLNQLFYRLDFEKLKVKSTFRQLGDIFPVKEISASERQLNWEYLFVSYENFIQGAVKEACDIYTKELLSGDLATLEIAYLVECRNMRTSLTKSEKVKLLKYLHKILTIQFASGIFPNFSNPGLANYLHCLGKTLAPNNDLTSSERAAIFFEPVFELLHDEKSLTEQLAPIFLNHPALSWFDYKLLEILLEFPSLQRFKRTHAVEELSRKIKDTESRFPF